MCATGVIHERTATLTRDTYIHTKYIRSTYINTLLLYARMVHISVQASGLQGLTDALLGSGFRLGLVPIRVRAV